jgi:aminocarboxymuconate-semialdehyde decarboxylase
MGSEEVTKPLKIDIHNHILPSKVPPFKEEFGYGGFIELHPKENGYADMVRDDGKFFRAVEPNCMDIEVRLEEMDRFGVDIQVLSTVPVMFSEWAKPEHTLRVNHFLNEDIAEKVSRYPKRFIGLGTIPLNDPELGCRELEVCINDLKLPGVQIGSHYGSLNLSDKSLFPFYEEAEKLGAAILVHPWDMMGKDTMPDYWLPWLVGMPAETTRAICSMIFGGVFEKFPKLRVCFAHGGGSFAYTLGRIEHGFNVRPDLCQVDNPINPREYLGKFYVDSINHDPKALQYNIDILGVNSIMLGTDYPFPLGELEPGKLIEEGMPHLSASDKERLLSGSALEWLNLPKEKFL